MGIMEFDFKSQEDEIANSSSSPSKAKQKNVRTRFLLQKPFFGEKCFRERNFSLKIRRIRPSAVDGARRGNVLRRAGYAWTPSLRVFDNSKR